jgi:hypothetical protein
MNTCHCDTPAPAGYLCTRHAEQLRNDIRATPGVLRDLEDTITGQAKQGGGGSTGERHVFNETASIAAEELRYLLRSVANDADPQDRHRYDESDAHLAARAWVGICSLVLQPGVQTSAQDLSEALRTARRCMDRSPERRVIGVCECGAALVTHRAAGSITCRSCERVWDVAATLEGRDRDAQDVEGTPAEIASYFTRVLDAPLTDVLVRRWASRGIIHAVGERGRAQLYRVGEVMVAWEMVKRRPLPGRVRPDGEASDDAA